MDPGHICALPTRKLRDGRVWRCGECAQRWVYLRRPGIMLKDRWVMIP